MMKLGQDIVLDYKDFIFIISRWNEFVLWSVENVEDAGGSKHQATISNTAF